jgi:DNA helicase-2/ATP-dependent DNA helicase PcrA
MLRLKFAPLPARPPLGNGTSSMRFHADLHVHSKYSRATSRNADLDHLAEWAARKGIAVVGTGDFTHPAWMAELRAKLIPAEPGLFRLRPELEAAIQQRLPAACPLAVRFMLEVEISTIYKKGDRTRKVHHLLYAPDFAAAERLTERLARIGNLNADGRPILGLDSRDLLEIALESGPDSYLIPAHIWTPWFAALGSRSGFDSIEDCYGDLAPQIFALETGLSSDPAMNWRISALDRYRLVSNSDAHSPIKLGREATTFETELDYFAIKRALATGEGFVGTLEFFPDEGKYHLDGHRACGLRLAPEETRRHGGRCPSCGQPVTVGVLHRVEALADRPEAAALPPPTAGAVTNLVPLHEVLAELAGSGPASRKVERSYQHLTGALGAELDILAAVPLEDVARAESGLLAEALARLRRGEVIREPGYDGEYGVIRLFAPDELRRRAAGGLLFELPGHLVHPRAEAKPGAERRNEAPPAAGVDPSPAAPAPMAPPLEAVVPPPVPGQPSLLQPLGLLAELDADQRAAAEIVAGPLLIVAGPGSGKTRTLTYRIAHLIAEHGAAPASCLAITFTRRAAQEMRERLGRLLGPRAEPIPVHTFHSLGLAILQEQAAAAGLAAELRIAEEAERLELLRLTLDLGERKARSLLGAIARAKRTLQPDSDEVLAAIEIYQQEMARRQWLDFDDLVGLPLQLLERRADLAAAYRARFRWLSVDEFQDLDEQQYRLIRALAPADGNVCAIGDPNQAIYGFRGADAACFARFAADYPAARTVRLARNYRSSGTIVAASSQVIAGQEAAAEVAKIARDMRERITMHAGGSEQAEAEYVVQTIERLIGGHSFFSIDSGRAGAGADAGLSFGDIAVLYRTDAQAGPICQALHRSGMPFARHSHERLVERPAVRAILAGLDLAAEGPLAPRLRALGDELAPADATAEALIEHRTALQHLLALAAAAGDRPARLRDALLLATEADCYDPRADRVALLTLHAAKGLEFKVVFITGLEDGILPLYFGERDPAALEEERRLLYVGMTRAEDRLILCRAAKRAWRGSVRKLQPSAFLHDIETELLRHSRAEPPARPAPDPQLSLF